MLDKFKKIKDRKLFCNVLSKLTGCNPQSIQNNWFRLFSAVPKPYIEVTENTIDKMIDYEKELSMLTEKLKQKHFGL